MGHRLPAPSAQARPGLPAPGVDEQRGRRVREIRRGLGIGLRRGRRHRRRAQQLRRLLRRDGGASSLLSLARRAASFSLARSLGPLARPPPSSRPRPRPRCSGARLASLLSLAIAPAFRRHHSIAPRLRTATAVKPQASLLFGASVCRARSKHSSPPSSLLSSSSPPSSLLRRCHRV